MPLIPISSELPKVQVKFVLPKEDFPENNIETFKGYSVGSYAVYVSDYRDLYLVKVKTTEDTNVVIADGRSLSLGKLKAGQRVKKTVSDIVYQLQVMPAFEFVTNVLLKDPYTVELNLTEKGSSK